MGNYIFIQKHKYAIQRRLDSLEIILPDKQASIAIPLNLKSFFVERDFKAFGEYCYKKVAWREMLLPLLDWFIDLSDDDIDFILNCFEKCKAFQEVEQLVGIG